MTEIWLVRHGETEWSAAGRHTSTTDLDLTPGGEAAARALRERLSGREFQTVLVSPLRRARRTARLAGFDDDSVAVDDDLIEWRYGDYEGLTSAQIHEHDPGWTIFTGRTPGGEEPDQVRERVQRVIDRVVGSGAEAALVVAHGHLLRSLALTWLGLDLAHGPAFPLGTASVSVLAEVKGRRALQRWNCPA